MSTESFSDLFIEIKNARVKIIDWKNRKDRDVIKLITFVYSSIMDFPENKFEIKTVVTKKINSIKDLLFHSYVIHHSHVTTKIVGYAHEFCNKKLRKTKKLIPFFAHNLLSFDFFFVVKGIRLCVWHTEQLNVRGTNLTNAQYANIGSQVKFTDIIKYYNQSLLLLAKVADENEKINIKSCSKFIGTNPRNSSVSNSLSDENKEWILDYSSGGKGVVPIKK